MNARILLAGLAGALALLAAAELLTGPAALPAATLALPAATAPAATSVYNARWATIILARPLFRSDRRPVQAVAATAAVVDNTLPRLSAIIITGTARAAVFDGDGGAPSVVSTGGRLGAYQVLAIAPDQVRLAGPNGNVVVRPQFAGAAPDAAPAPVPMTPDGLPAFGPNGAPLGGGPTGRFPGGL